MKYKLQISRFIFSKKKSNNSSNFRGFSIIESFILFSAILLVIAVIFYIYFSQKIYSKDTLITLEKQSQRIEKSLVDTIEYSAYLMDYLGKQISKHDSKNLQYIDSLLASFRLDSDVNDKTPWNMFSWADDKMRILVNSNLGILAQPVDISDRDYIKLSFNHPGKIYLGKPSIGRISGAKIIPAGMDVVNGDKRLGSIIFGFRISKLSEKLWNSTNSDDVSFVVLDYDGDFIMSSNDFVPNEKLSKAIKSAIASPKISGETGKFLPFGANDDYAFFQKIEKYSYIVVVRYNSSYVQRNLITKIYPHFSGILILILFLLFILMVLHFLIIRPILFLSRASKMISSGCLEISVPKSNIHEINQLSQSILMVRDFIAEEQKSKMQLDIARQVAEKANISKITLLRSITHDIKNYIFGISGLVKLILENKSASQILHNKDLQAIETIGSQSEELMHFVEDLLDTNQVESGELSLGVMDFCNIADLINRMLLLNSGLAIKHQVILAIDVEDNLPHLKCDIRRVKQILTNLIGNAIKYSKPETTVKISAKYLRQENQIYFEISDQGIGMNEEEVKMILSGRGKNIDKSALMRAIDSHGVGMPIVLRLIKLHRAKIKIESEKNIGTTVKLYFNITEEELPKNKVGHRKTVKNKSILLVEDNPVNIKITSMILRNAGYKTSYVENGKEALKILDEKNFNLILMDGEMPVMNGYQATAAIRNGSSFKKFKNYKTIPIIALMSSSDPETIKKSRESGMNNHVEKSASKNKLLDIIARYLE